MSQKECSICLDDFKETDSPKTTSCNHSFHEGCLTKWINMKKNTCPICRNLLELYKKTVHSYSNLYATIDEFIEILGEPRRMPSDDLDVTRLEWFHQTIYCYQIGISTSEYIPFFEEGKNRVECVEIFLLLRDKWANKHIVRNEELVLNVLSSINDTV